MNKTLLTLLAALLAGCVQQTTSTEPKPAPTTEPTEEILVEEPEETYNTCTVIGYRTLQYTPSYSEEVAVAVDSFGHEHLLDISDAMIGDTYTIRYGVVIEETYEGYSEENDYYIIQFENGDLHEIESDDLQVGDEVTVYFWEDRPVRLYYGIR